MIKQTQTTGHLKNVTQEDLIKKGCKRRNKRRPDSWRLQEEQMPVARRTDETTRRWRYSHCCLYTKHVFVCLARSLVLWYPVCLHFLLCLDEFRLFGLQYYFSQSDHIIFNTTYWISCTSLGWRISTDRHWLSVVMCTDWCWCRWVDKRVNTTHTRRSHGVWYDVRASVGDWRSGGVNQAFRHAASSMFRLYYLLTLVQ